jgi:SAM-dependent methyltransferase
LLDRALASNASARGLVGRYLGGARPEALRALPGLVRQGVVVRSLAALEQARAASQGWLVPSSRCKPPRRGATRGGRLVRGEDVVTSTDAWYARHASSFVAATQHVDMSSFHERFLSLLPAPADILDVGCGSGRDSRAFLALGHRVVALEPCEALALGAEAAMGQPVLRRRAQEVDAHAAFDGIWACASLLHLTATETPAVLARLARALRPGGVLYASYKLGEGEREEDGRAFLDMTPGTLEPLLLQASLTLVDLWQTNDARPGRTDRWLNALART